MILLRASQRARAASFKIRARLLVVVWTVEASLCWRSGRELVPVRNTTDPFLLLTFRLLSCGIMSWLRGGNVPSSERSASVFWDAIDTNLCHTYHHRATKYMDGGRECRRGRCTYYSTPITPAKVKTLSGVGHHCLSFPFFTKTKATAGKYWVIERCSTV